MLTMLLADAQDKKACKIFNNHLAVINDRVNKKPWQNLGEVNVAINSLEAITGITSQSDGNYFGRYYPTLEDYEKWSAWFKENSLRLYWDKKEKKVKVKTPL